MKKRVSWIDIAKGISIIAIILGHSGLYINGFPLKNFFFPFHLSTFFILSGYTLKQEVVNREYLNKKFKRLMTPYFITCFLIIIMDIINKLLFSNLNDSINSITYGIGKDIIRSFFASGSITKFGTIEIGTRIGAIWFLPALFFAIVCSQIILNKIKEPKKQFLISFAIVLITYLSARFLWLPFSIQSGLFAQLFILIGYYIREYKILDKIKFSNTIILLMFYLFGVFFGYADTYFVVLNFNDIFVNSIVTLSGTLLIMKLSQKLERFKLLRWIGENSLYILCIHLFEMETMNLYFNKFLSFLKLGNTHYNYFYLIPRFLFIFIVLLCILGLKKGLNNIKNKPIEENKRDITIDIMRGILIISMIMGHVPINNQLRVIIYSIHMISFVFLSGYLYNQKLDLRTQLKKIFKGLIIPYLLFCILYLLINYRLVLDNGILFYIKQLLLGMSFSNRILKQIPSVGPIYFILLLILCRVIYSIINKIAKNKYIKFIIIFIISFIGYKLGNNGYWLPWSFDIAMYSLIYFYLGVLFREKDLLNYISSNYISYFILSPIWIYMIYKGGMEIAIRNYGLYGIVIIGSISGIVLLFMLCKYLSSIKLNFISKILSIIGCNSIYILLAHTLLSKYINNFLIEFLPNNCFKYFILFIVLNIAIGLVFSLFIKTINLMKRKVNFRRKLRIV